MGARETFPVPYSKRFKASMVQKLATPGGPVRANSQMRRLVLDS